jgi:hypothetical protein
MCCEFNCPQKNTNGQFYKCPMRINTMFFHIRNEYEYYKKAQRFNFDFLKYDFELCENDIIDIILLYLEDEKENQ